MPRNYKNPSIVSGMSVKDILNMDNQTFNSLSESDLRKTVGRLVSAGNKRLRTFEKHGESGPAVWEVDRSGGKFSTKGKSMTELQTEYKRAKDFLTSHTGTLKKWKKIKNQTVQTLSKKGIDLPEDKIEDVLRVYDRLKEADPTVEDAAFKYKVIDEIGDTLEDIAEETGDDEDVIDSVVNAMKETIKTLYEEQRENEPNDGVSSFFEL